jgi:hypothetical protein
MAGFPPCCDGSVAGKQKGKETTMRMINGRLLAPE